MSTAGRSRQPLDDRKATVFIPTNPLVFTVEECKLAEEAVERHPELAFFLGFMRRFDPSYAYAKKKIEEGAIGTPYMVKATGIDPEALVEGAIKFAATSGGIFIDMAIHDIDLMRWFLGSDPVEVYAAGATFKHPEFKEAGDDETGVAMYRCENGALGFVHVGRTAAHGYHVETEIIGTEGSLRISPVPEKNLCMIYDKNGAVVECVSGFPERFAESYQLEMQEFINCVESGRKPEEITLLAATKTVPVPVINRAIELGITCIGENKVQELCEKYDQLHLEHCDCHFIGHLQTNKVKQLIGKVSMIHSVDSVKLAKEISKISQQQHLVTDILVEINVGKEESKGGIYIEDTESFLGRNIHIIWYFCKRIDDNTARRRKYYKNNTLF